MMDYKARILPTRDALSRVQKQGNLDTDVSGIDLVLNLITTADLIRASIYKQLTENHGISEGKFALLMSLYGEGATTASDLALRIGVTPATVSIMVKRMLAVPEPLISMSINNDDGRSRLITLTSVGLELIKQSLPEHFKSVKTFAAVLNEQERESLISMLRKLLRAES